ncbi:hypothetical protein JHD46_08225 [Sulfurimonas sp. SAG-AH-194-C20]|nr:hypothetical protein [Sulfurimonas sp. SAG-AH-194-C20]MDF1879621.1 hypothetical protein [Sulfurimonas sp. SAG-AH-194-C20]
MDAAYVSEYLRDIAKDNVSLDALEQFGEDFIDTIIPMAVSEANIMYPSLKGTLIPDSTMIYGVLALLMESESFKELRNQIEYQDNNASVSLSVKESQYERKSQLMRQTFNRQLDSLSATKFLDSCWGNSISNSRSIGVNIGFGYS